MMGNGAAGQVGSDGAATTASGGGIALKGQPHRRRRKTHEVADCLLGKGAHFALSMMETERPDLSQLIPPLPTNTQGVHRLLSAFRSGTSEIKNLLNQECNVILECKICQSMFRGLPNFISHKRVYCRKTSPPLEGLLHNNKLPEYYSSIETIENELGRRDIDQIATRLSKTATIAGTDGVRGENPEASQNVVYYTAIADTIKSRRAAQVQHKTILTAIPGTSQAVSQTIKVVEEADEVEEKPSELGPPNKKRHKKSDDKSVNANSPEGTKSQNNSQTKGDKEPLYTVLQYPCPLCKKVFSKPNGTYRHIRDIHKKNNEQLEKMKNAIRKRAFSVTISKKSSESQVPLAQNNNAPPKPATKPQMVQPSRHMTRAQQEELKEWNDHTFTIDVGDHRCGYCGTKYERRAALLSHAKQCFKKSKSVIKKPVPQTAVKSKGAANRKVTTPMKIVRKYLMSNSKSESVEGSRLANGVMNASKDVRRSTRSSGNPVGRPRIGHKITKEKMVPTVPLTRIKLPLPEQTKPTTNAKPPVPVAPLQTPLTLEKMLRDQKSNASNILVRQVSDKAALSPSKVTTPTKEPPVVASVTPILSVKPKDGYPVNYFSPGSADTKLIGTGNSVPSSIQIRKDYKKSNPSGDDSVDGCSTASVCSDKAEDCADTGKSSNSVISPSIESARSKRPVLNFDKPITNVEKMQSCKVKELVGVIENLSQEAKAEEVADSCKVCAEEIASNPETQQPEEKSNATPSKNNLATHITLKQVSGEGLSLKLNSSAARIVAVPLKSLEKIPKLPNVGSTYKLTLASNFLSGISKVVTTDNNSSPSTVADAESKSSAPVSAPLESTTSSPSRNPPDMPSTSTNNNVPETFNFVPEETCEVKCETAEEKTESEGNFAEIAESNPQTKEVPQESTSQGAAALMYPNLDVPEEYLVEEDSDFEGWNPKEKQPSLAIVCRNKFLKFHEFFEEDVRRTEEHNKIVVELDLTDSPFELPPGVLVEYLGE